MSAPPVPAAPPAAPATGGARRRRTVSASRRWPLANLVLAEVGVGTGLLLLALDLRGVAVAVTVLVVALAVGRWHGRWWTQWALVAGRYCTRRRGRRVAAASTVPTPPPTTTGAEDPRITALRLVVEDLVVTTGTDHEQQPVGLTWHRGVWTAVVAVDPEAPLVGPVGVRTDVPLAALSACLVDRGVVLDGIQVVRHSRRAGSEHDPDTPALAAYRELLGPLPALGRRTTWVAVRLDPRRCPEAVRERGGGVVGAHRALVGALARVRTTLDAAGMASRVLDVDQVLRATTTCAGLSTALGGAAGAGPGADLVLRETWRGVSVGRVGHASHAVRGWSPSTGGLESLVSTRARSCTVSLDLSPGQDTGRTQVRTVVRVSAHSPQQLRVADQDLRRRAAAAGIRLTPLHGEQVAALAASLPVGGTG